VHVPYLTQGPSHLLDHLHVFEGRVQGIGSRAHTIHHRVPRRLGGAPNTVSYTQLTLPTKRIV
jgi:hypothetical protein